MFLSHLREDRITRGKAQCLLAVGVPLDMRQLAYPSRGYYSRYSLRLAYLLFGNQGAYGERFFASGGI